MTDTDLIAEIRARAEAATPGPWERGYRQLVAGVMPEMFGEGNCSYCRDGDEPTWGGRRSINGKMMLAHVHTRPEPWSDHSIVFAAEDGPVTVVVETEEYGLIDPPDAEFIAHAREDIPFLLNEVSALREAIEKARELIEELVDPDNCWFDHNGGCQAHGYISLLPGEKCPVRDAKDWLGGLVPAVASPETRNEGDN